jgi:predicted YcjX-like family ATPase
MTTQTIDIADLVTPKFQPGQIVYLVISDTHGVESVRRVLIDEIRFVVRFKRSSGSDKFFRETSLVYDLLNNGQSREDRLFASLEEAARSAK